LFDHTLGVVRPVAHQRRDRVQRVEQEMRIDACLERGELRFSREPTRFGFGLFEWQGLFLKRRRWGMQRQAS